MLYMADFLNICRKRKKKEPSMMIPKLGYKDSNLEMLESESSALPFGDSPSVFCCVRLSLNEGYYNKGQNKMQVLF